MNNNQFLMRADEHIELANSQLNETTTQGEVSASLMYAAARFNAWMASTSFESAEAMKEEKEKIIEYFIKEYKIALAENIDNHIENYDFSQNDL
ncbi:hypothetical protein CRU98_04415 [Arcobacter sp. CECT 8986]|uniref:DUF3144 domain-containing protein n=1 Tax=Arcobacter sp. CECT 8986 TaxID=2044507 RepID=UPI0010098C99|nr:DUF3144 domain-containing protein [Arcobacter sp. CECT 8986]RXK00408.1 hypothetical protein CRU98_04415 [Arcobacter sp. CECT 8986]